MGSLGLQHQGGRDGQCRSNSPPTGPVQAGSPHHNTRPKLDAQRWLRTRLGNRLLGHDLDADCLARNGFRLLSLPAHATQQAVRQASQRFQSQFEMSAQRALKGSIRTGYDEFLKEDDALECVRQLRDSRRRLLAEVFWPHLPAEQFEAVSAAGSISAPRTLESLAKFQQAVPEDGMLVMHATAVAQFHAALNLEFSAGCAAAREAWRSAHRLWAGVLATAPFWNYMGGRVAALGDSRLRADDLDGLKTALPQVILSYNALLAETYAAAGSVDECRMHLSLIAAGPFPPAIQREALAGAVQKVSRKRLEPLARWADDPFTPPPGFAAPAAARTADKLPRKPFDALYTPILSAAQAVHGWLTDELRLTKEVAACAEFDAFCMNFDNALNTRLDYSNDNKRSILYVMLKRKRLLELPLSSAGREKLEHQQADDCRAFFQDFIPEKDANPTVCYFFPLAEADPDASIDMPLNKLMAYLGNGDYRMSQISFIVPRSVAAQNAHRARKAPEVRPEQLGERGAAIQASRTAAEEHRKAVEAAARAASDRAVAAFNAKADADSAALKAELTAQTAQLRALQSRHDPLLADYKRVHAGDVDRVRAGQAAALAQVKAASEAQQAKWKFSACWYMLHVPAFLVAASSCAEAAWYFSSSAMDPLAAFAMALIGGAVGGVLAGALPASALAAWRFNAAAEPVKREAKRIDELAAAAAASVQQGLQALEKARSQECAAADARVKSCTDKLAAQDSARKVRLNELAKTRDQTIADANKTAAAATSRLDDEMKALCEFKDESKKTEYPAYKKAKSLDYKDGLEPSQPDLEAMRRKAADKIAEELSPQERNLYDRVHAKLNSDGQKALREVLAGTARGERMKVLLELGRKFLNL